jgi:hypothetical protein
VISAAGIPSAKGRNPMWCPGAESAGGRSVNRRSVPGAMVCSPATHEDSPERLGT